MPCREKPDDSDLRNARKKLDERTAQLCSLCRVLESHGLNELMPREVSMWWELHKQFDRSRAAKETFKGKKFP